MTDNENICNGLWITGFQAFYLEIKSLELDDWLITTIWFHENSSERLDTYVTEYTAVGWRKSLTAQANANHPSAS
jgi:hypothetical protein